MSATRSSGLLLERYAGIRLAVNAIRTRLIDSLTGPLNQALRAHFNSIQQDPCQIHHYQPSSERRDKWWNKHWVIYRFFLGLGHIVEESEVFQVLKQSNEVYDFPTGSFGLF